MLAVAAAFSVLCSCAPTPLDTNFAGTWVGSTTLDIANLGMTTSSSEVVVTVSANSVAVGNICPGGTGSVTATGSGESATWSGTLSCPAIALPGCILVVVAYIGGTATLNFSDSITGANTLNVMATGTANGCGATNALTATFVGVKQAG